MPRCFFPLLAGLLPAMVPAALAHPLHASSGEAHYNGETRKLEVSVAVFTSDLATALTARARRPVSMDKTAPAELDSLIQSYLKDSFPVQSRTGTPLPLTWVGRGPEASGKPASGPAAAAPDPAAAAGDARTMLYFEIPLPEGVAGISLKYGLLTETFPDQKNTLTLHEGRREVTLRFSPSSPAKSVVLPP